MQYSSGVGPNIVRGIAPSFPVESNSLSYIPGAVSTIHTRVDIRNINTSNINTPTLA